MSRKVRIWISEEDGCLAYKIRCVGGGQDFGYSKEKELDGQIVLRNFQWLLLPGQYETLAAFVKHTADRSYEADLARYGPEGIIRVGGRIHRYTLRRMPVERIKIKPDMEERYQRILARLPVQEEPEVHPCMVDDCDGAHCGVCGGHFLEFYGEPGRICTSCMSLSDRDRRRITAAVKKKHKAAFA